MPYLPDEKAFYSISEAARALMVSEATIYRLFRSGDLPRHRIAGRRTIVARADLERLLEAGERRERVL
jgi:excisionase family DNA binding protein